MLRVNGVGVEINSAELPTSAIDWLIAHQPQVADGDAKMTVSLAVEFSASSFERIANNLASGTPVAYYMESNCIEVANADGSRTWFLAGLEGIADHALLANASRTRFNLIFPGQGELVDRTVLRVLRMITRGSLLQNGGVLVHSSSVSWADGGALFLGASGKGKTSAAVTAALVLRGAQLVSTDRTVVIEGPEGRPVAYGGPEMHRLGMGLIDATPQLRLESRVRDDAGVAAAITQEARGFGARSKAEYTFLDFARLGVGSRDHSSLSHLVLIETAEQESLEDLRHIESRGGWTAEILHPDPGLRFPTHRTLGPERAVNMFLELSGRMNIRRLCWNPQVAGSLERMIVQLADSQ